MLPGVNQPRLFQVTKIWVICVWILTAAVRGYTKRKVYSCDAVRPFAVHFGKQLVEIFAAENASDVTRRCLQLFGGYGYTRDYPIERMMRDAKITEIYEGTSEVQRMVISGNLGVK